MQNACPAHGGHTMPHLPNLHSGVAAVKMDEHQRTKAGNTNVELEVDSLKLLDDYI